MGVSMRKTYDFAGGRDGFRYADDMFRFTDEPDYAHGRHEKGKLAMRLGGGDDATARGLSGGWTKGFELDATETVTVSFRYKISHDGEMRAKDFADLRIAIDGEPVEVAGRAFVARLNGEDAGGRSAWRTVEIDLGALDAGRHDVTIGGYVSRKIGRAETKFQIDDVVIASKAKPAVKLGAFEAEVLRLSNDFRAAHGLDPLEADRKLTKAAEDWSREMANGDFFRHSKTATQIDDFGYDARGWGENIAAGYPTPKDVVKGWINSPGHRANLLREDFEHLGVGHYHLKDDRGSVNHGHYWTQIFGTPSDDYI